MKFRLLLLLVAAFTVSTKLAAAEVDFAHDVVPILKQHCAKCHTGNQLKGGLSFNTRESLLAGGESGKVVIEGKSGASGLLARITSTDKETQMPPEGPRVTAKEIAVLKNWIDGGLRWEAGFTFGERAYEPPLKPRRVDLPPATAGRNHPVDRIIDAYLAKNKLPQPKLCDEATFIRRAHLDIIGLLPTPEELERFQKETRNDKRTLLVRELLARDVDYAEHWLTFWNDLLRNDYSGTGFITGGRKQITKWLYDALVSNKPYDQFARELIAPPTPESAGFGEGIRWRGDVSAGQTVEIQFAQSVGQSFLGINLKCASCHDSFIDRWKLEESYALAAVFSQRPLPIHRCDQPTGQTAKAGWLFPELGQVDPAAPQPERLKQLAALLTHPENGRFSRTIVNRLWHRMLGRGIVHPTDAMQTEPWNADLLDYLATDFASEGYNLKHTIELIATSQAYQSQVAALDEKSAHAAKVVYTGPRAKRLTAEQFVDAVWQLTGSAPAKFDAPVARGGNPQPGGAVDKLTGKWIWSRADASDAAAGETVVFRRQFDLAKAPKAAIAVVTCDNSYVLFVNGQRTLAGENWEAPDAAAIGPRLVAGKNEILIVAKNGGAGPNLAGLYCELRITDAEGKAQQIGTDEAWQWTLQQPAASGKYTAEPRDWQAAKLSTKSDVWGPRVEGELRQKLSQSSSSSAKMVRASLVKSDFLMRSLGRPNRDQIVSVRPEALTTLEAIDLSNGQTLASMLEIGAKKLATQNTGTPEAFARDTFRHALSREPTAAEWQVLREALGDKLTEQSIQDVFWVVIMMPEFQFVR